MKHKCTYQRDVERWFDGEIEVPDSIEAHVETCESCKAHVAFLGECRDVIAEAPAAPNIADGQMPAFLEGISEAVHRPKRHSTGFWAMASALTAALIVAVSTVTIVSTGPEPVGAETVIESVSTDIDGATVEILNEDSTTPTAWVNEPEGGEI